MRSRPFVIFLLLLFLAAIACAIPSGDTTPDLHALATNVAGTLTALSGGPSGGGPTDSSTTPLPPGTTVLPGDTPTFTPALLPPPHLRVALISSGNVWIVEPPGAPVQRTSAGNVDGVYLSDDGAKAVYTRHNSDSEPTEIRVVNTDGSNDHVLISPSQINALYPLGSVLYYDIASLEFIPGTHRLLMNTRGVMDGPGLLKNDDLLLLDADTGALTTIFAPGSGGDATPSPDGSRMALVRTTNVSVCNINGGGMFANVITFPVILTYSEYGYYPEPVWAADSTRFGIIIPSPEQLAPSPTGAIWSVNASTGAAGLQSTLPGQFMFPRAVLSPDLAHLGYTRPAAAPPDAKDSFVSNLDGSAALHLATNLNTGVISFSPDGQHFLYYVGEPGNVLIGTLGGGTLPLVSNLIRARWVNNSQFVMAVGTYASWTLILGNVSGGVTTIASPSGDRLTFDVDE